MGKPRFRGLAALPEVREFRRAGVPTVLGKEYLKASRRAFWFLMGISVMSGIIGPMILGPIVAGTQIAWNLLVVFLVLFVVSVSVVSFIMGRRPPGDR
jgi:hypothetical protein